MHYLDVRNFNSFQSVIEEREENNNRIELMHSFAHPIEEVTDQQSPHSGDVPNFGLE